MVESYQNSLAMCLYMAVTSLWSIRMTLSIDSSRRSEGFLSPLRFLSSVLINFSLENGCSTEADVTRIVAYVFRSQTREN